MIWTNVCVEGFCFSKTDDDIAPCGASVPSPFCLSNGICPHFAYSGTTEREVAHFPKFGLILRDRLGIWADGVYWKLRWWFWDCLWFNQRKTREFFDNIKVATAETSPIIAKMEEEDRKRQEKFVGWFKRAKME